MTSQADNWRFTGFYGHPEEDLKHETGELMKHLSREESLPWLCGGDFNLLLTAKEKKREEMVLIPVWLIFFEVQSNFVTCRMLFTQVMITRGVMVGEETTISKSAWIDF